MSASKPHSEPPVMATDFAIVVSGLGLVGDGYDDERGAALHRIRNRMASLEEQLEAAQLALQYCVDHCESLGYTHSAMWMRELQEAVRGERSWEDAGVFQAPTSTPVLSTTPPSAAGTGVPVAGVETSTNPVESIRLIAVAGCECEVCQAIRASYPAKERQ